MLANITNVKKTILDILPLPDAAIRRSQSRKLRAERSEILIASLF